MALLPLASGSEARGFWASTAASSIRRVVRRRSPSSASANSWTAQVVSSTRLLIRRSCVQGVIIGRIQGFHAFSIPQDTRKQKLWVTGSYFKQGLSYLDALEFRIMKDPLTRTTALRAGEIDLIDRIPMQQVALLERSAGITVVTGPAMIPTVALLNLRVKPFDDVRARRAVGGYGLDRAEIARVAFQGRAQALVSVLPPGVPDAIDVNEMYPYKPDEAKRLLNELGYDAKHPLQFTILISNLDATMADIAALIKSQMAKIGVEAKINLMDDTAVVERLLVKHDFDMLVSFFANLVDINQRSVSFFKGRQSDYMGMDDPQLEAMVLQWRRTLEPAQRKAISADIQRRLADQLEWVNVTTYPFFQAYRTAAVHKFLFYNHALLVFDTTWLAK